MVRKLGTWLLGVAACAQASCYQHHTADEELLGLPEPGSAVTDAGPDGAASNGNAGARADGGGLGCGPGADALTQLACSFLGDAGAGAGNINDLINSLGGLGALGGILGGGTGTGGRDAGAALAGLPTAAQCQNPTDMLTQLFCSLGGGGANPFGRRDAGLLPMAPNPPPAQPADAGAAVIEDAGVPAVGDAGVGDAAAAP